MLINIFYKSSYLMFLAVLFRNSFQNKESARHSNIPFPLVVKSQLLLSFIVLLCSNSNSKIVIVSVDVNLPKNNLCYSFAVCLSVQSTSRLISTKRQTKLPGPLFSRQPIDNCEIFSKVHPYEICLYALPWASLSLINFPQPISEASRFKFQCCWLRNFRTNCY
jgi:hypothetical protein